MIVLEGIDLGTDIHIEDEFSISRVQSTMVRSKDGVPLIWEQSVDSPEFDLVGMSNRGVLKRGIIEQIKALADVPNAQYTLSYDGNDKNVRFRNWEGSAIEGNPLGPRESMSDDDLYTDVRIKLMEV